MNSIQRVLATLTFGKSEHGRPDRVPVFPVPLMQGALVYKCTVADYFAMSAERIAGAQIELNQMLGGVPDAVAGIPHVVEDVTAFGVELASSYPNSSPTINGMRLRAYDDITGLRCPTPGQSAQLTKTLKTISILRSRIGSEKIVIGACVAPFSLPSLLMGTSKWMRLLFTPALRERYLARLLDVCKQFVIAWSNEQLRAGAHVIVMADGMASSTILPRKMFEDYARPVIKDTIRGISGFVAYEPVGTIEPYIDACADLGAIALLIGQEDDIRSCKAKLHGRVGLIGNVNNMKMRRWSPARIELQAKAALRHGMPGYGFILANQGPEIPFDTSVEGIAALVNTVEKYGRYDVTNVAAAAA